MTTTTSLWQPTKAASEYDDNEVQATPIFKRLTETTGLPAKDVLPFARGAIDEMWRKQRQVRFAAPVAALFAAFDASGEQVGDAVIINRDGSFRPAKKAAASAADGGRMKNSDYARFIGKGNGHAKARHGGYVLEVTQARNPNRNGHFELVILPGIKGNKVCEEMQAKLYQYPANGQKAAVICYPPLVGDRAEHRKGINLTQNDSVIEVSAMSGMMKASILATPQTPAQMFKLTDLLRSSGKPADSAASADEEDEEEPVDADEAAASSILGDDDEEYGADD